MTARFDAFKAELIALLDKHKLMLSSSLYDSPAIQDQDAEDPQPIWCDNLRDETDGETLGLP